jgi:hypothetical protein
VPPTPAIAESHTSCGTSVRKRSSVRIAASKEHPRNSIERLPHGSQRGGFEIEQISEHAVRPKQLSLDLLSLLGRQTGHWPFI